MVKLTTLLLLVLLMPLSATGQPGTIAESRTIESAILGGEVTYSLYLPPDYDQSIRHYPVLYLLHGFSDNDTGWVQFGEVKAIADQKIGNVEVTPMIIVMPDAGTSWYINNHDGSVRYEDFFVDELIPHIDNTYRTRPEKQFRAVAGLSMGGYGSLVLSMKHPHLFAASAPLSAGIRTDDEITAIPDESWDAVYGVPFGEGRQQQERLTEHYLENSVLHIVRTADAEKLKTVRYYIDCGDKDFLIKGNMALHAAMLDREIPNEFRVREGAHTWSYWRSALPEVFRFVSESFHR